MRPPRKREDPITAPRCPKCEALLDLDAITTEGKRLLICRRKTQRIANGERERCGQRIYLLVVGRVAHVQPITAERYAWVLEFARRHGHGPEDPMDDPEGPRPHEEAA